MSDTTALPSVTDRRPRRVLPPLTEGATMGIVPWLDPVADPHGVHPCSRYVELYWLGIIGPSTMEYEPIEDPGRLACATVLPP